MTTSRKTAHKKTVTKDTAPPQHAVQVEMPEEENSLLINSPYEIFGPLFELVTTPWRLFFPFTPWPIKPVKELDVIREFTGRV